MASVKIKPGQLIGHRYRVERSLGSKEPGCVFLCTDLREGESRVVMRIMGGADSDEKYLTSLRQRFSILGRIRNPGLARFLDLGISEADQRPFLVSEFVEGDELSIASTGWGVERIVQTLVKVCRALQHLHSERIVHGNLKASNVICTNSDTGSELIRVLDYGLSHDVQERTQGLNASQLAYSAPEVLLGQPPSVLSDLYSLGVLAYQLLTRRLPFEQDDQGYIVQKHLQGRADMRAVERLESGFGLAQALRDLLEKDPARRPSSAVEVVRLLCAATGRDYSSGVRVPVEGCFSQGRFVGRQKEMSFLQERAEKVREGRRGWTVFVLGEAGAGKTRCMEEFRTWALLHGWHIIEGRCLPQDSRSYHPYRQVLESTKSPIEDSACQSELRDAIQFMADPGIVEAGAHEILTESAAGQYRDLLAREVLRRLTSGPTLLFLHDFHWADEATTTVLEYLISDISTHSILICVSLRPGEVETNPIGRLMEQCARQLRSETLTLSTLSAASVEDLVASMTGDPALGKRIGSWTHKCSGGNPFFAEEILKHLVERGLLSRGLDTWKFEQEGIESLEVPASIAVIFRHRLGRLSQAARELAQWLAVFNRAVPADLLRSAASFNEAEMSRALEELLSIQTMQLVSNEGGECIDFRHALIGEVIREDISPIRLRAMHRKIGEEIEKQFGPDKHYLELATHYTEGNCGEKAIRFALKAATACRAEFANGTAVKFYEYILRHKRSLTNEENCEISIDAAEAYCSLGQAKRALKILGDIVTGIGDRISRYLRARVMVQIATAYQHLDDLQKLEASAKAGLSLLGSDDSINAKRIRILLLRRLSFSFLLKSKPKRGLVLLQKALKSLPQYDSLLLSQIYVSISAMHSLACNPRESLVAARRSIEILGSIPASELRAGAYSLMGTSMYALGRFRSALNYHEQAARLGQTTRSLIAQSQAVGNLAESLFRFGRIREAVSLCEKAIELSSEAGNRSIRHAVLTIQAEINIYRGEYQAALSILDGLAKELKSVNADYSKAHAILISAQIAFELADYDLALRHLLILKKESSRAQLYDYVPGEILRARIYIERNQSARALLLLLRTDKSMAKKRWPYHRCLTKLSLAEVYAERCAWESAKLSARSALRLARVMPCPRFECSARYQLARIEYKVLQSRCSTISAGVATPEIPKESLTGIKSQLSAAIIIAESLDECESVWRAASYHAEIDELLMNVESSLANSRKVLNCLDSLEQRVPTRYLQMYRQLPARIKARRDCQERLRRLGFSEEERQLDIERIEGAHLRALFRASGMINKIRDLHQLVETVAAQLLEVTLMNRAFVFLAEEKNRRLRSVGSMIVDQGATAQMKPPERQLIDSIFESGQPFMSVNCAADNRLAEFFLGDECRPGAIYCAPLHAGGKCVGILYADNPSSKENLGESTMDLFAAFCNMAAVALDNAMAHQYLLKEKTELQEHLRLASEGYPEIVGKSAAMKQLRERIALVAASPLDVLIMGESGTGKELVARALHRTGRRATGVFLPLDCGALSDSLIESELFGYRKGAFTGAIENRAGLLETAKGGVVFLDEISNLSLKLQGKLLRVLQEREVRRIGETQHRSIDVQIIAATNRNLIGEMRKGRFRKDLYYRLNAMQIQLAPLREHMEDVPLLVDWFLHKTALMEDGKTKAFSPEALKFLQSYSFPGNVRELCNVLQSSYYSCPGGLIQIEHLPAEIKESTEDQSPGGREVTAGLLYDKIREGRGNFEELIKRPFLRRSFGRNIVRQVLRRALLETEGRYREAFRLLRIPAAQYSSMMIFLKRHDCYLDFRGFRQAGSSQI